MLNNTNDTRETSTYCGHNIPSQIVSNTVSPATSCVPSEHTKWVVCQHISEEQLWCSLLMTKQHTCAALSKWTDMSTDKIMLTTADTIQLHSYKHQHVHCRYNNITVGISYHMLHQKKQQNIIILQTRKTWLTLKLQISISAPTNLDYQDFLGPR